MPPPRDARCMTPLDRPSVHRPARSGVRRRARAAGAAAASAIIIALVAAFVAITPGAATAVGLAGVRAADQQTVPDAGSVPRGERWPAAASSRSITATAW